MHHRAREAVAKARIRARRARRGRGKGRRVLERARKARGRGRKKWSKFKGRYAKQLGRADKKARNMRHAARVARGYSNNPKEMRYKVLYARRAARIARAKLAREAHNKKVGKSRASRVCRAPRMAPRPRLH